MLKMLFVVSRMAMPELQTAYQSSNEERYAG
jgi:hypothetical protein